MLTDEQLAVRVAAGDELAMRALATRFASMTRSLARDVYAAGLDRDDLDQEAQIALYIAARSWRGGHGLAFASFAREVVRRRLISVVIAARRVKHDLLSFADRVVVLEDGQTVAAVDVLEAANADAYEIIAEREQLRTVVRTIRDGLSPLEREWLVGHVFCGRPYAEDGVDKRADNALQRARRTLTHALAEADAAPLERAA